MLGKIEGGRRRGGQRMRWLDGIINGHEFEQTLRAGDRQGQHPWSLACKHPGPTVLFSSLAASGRSVQVIISAMKKNKGA